MASDFHGAHRTLKLPRDAGDHERPQYLALSAVWPFLNGKEPDGYNVQR